ncbi:MULTISPECIES: tautomerase family protein [unclassified Achromobacter]|jgi:4-oxalocrotonate tautomerase|uniref:tautomerase family protein n=1 Tax=unclassified Achromobacter TaxID=2626865 RepID=UPI000B517BB5|nr:MULTISPECIES: tautomerase family protein [unclassified Achromobacter]OWT77410.1 4-oxalocrotonate tautomerase [Achromobacter sp. HZ28]OWT78291.1 4-oxalocrotonate tautomerase [Achromobacter sp. HZ34]
MPTIHAYITAGPSAQQKKALLTAASQAVVDSLGAPLRSVRLMLHDVAREDIMVGGEAGRDSVVFHVHMIVGRDEAQKQAMFTALTQAAGSTLGVDGENVRVIVQDVPNTDMGMANGVSAKNTGR